MGDFNAKIGREIEMEGCTGPYASGSTNKSGFKLGKLCQKLNLKIANTFFDRSLEEKWTWRSPDGKTKNEIDHLLTDCVSSFTEITTLNDFLFASDHRPVAACLTLRDSVHSPPPILANQIKKKEIY